MITTLILEKDTEKRENNLHHEVVRIWCKQLFIGKLLFVKDDGREFCRVLADVYGMKLVAKSSDDSGIEMRWVSRALEEKPKENQRRRRTR